MENLCRTCMTTVDGDDDRSFISVYSDTEMNDTVAGLLNTFCSMEISPDDPLPKQICPECVHELLTVINFRQKCAKSEQSLRQLVLEEQETEDAFVYFEPIEMDSKPSLEEGLQESLMEPAEVLQELEEEILVEQPYSVVEMMSFRCCLCAGILLYSEEEYRGHVQQVHGVDVTEGDDGRCVICLRGFDGGEELEQHQGKRFLELYQCNSCEDIYESVEDVKQHFGEVHEKGGNEQHPVEPDIKAEEPLVQEVPVKKIKLEANSERYCCVTHCHEVFSGEQELIVHAQEKHEIKLNHNKTKTEPDKPFICVVCFRSFGSVKNLKVHQFVRANHTQGKHFTCGDCPFRAASSALLTIHKRSKHSGERPFECPHCKKRFFSELYLKNHLVCHSSARPFPCQFCERSFSRKRNMEEHVRSCHSEDKPFHCDQCPARFKVPQHLRIHARIHSGEKPYRCQFCPNSYYHISDRKRHEMSHTGVRPYRCETCGAAFTRKRTLTIHARTHTGLRPFGCAICSKGFCQSATYKKHMERHEGALVVEEEEEAVAATTELLEVDGDESAESDGEMVEEGGKKSKKLNIYKKSMLQNNLNHSRKNLPKKHFNTGHG